MRRPVGLTSGSRLGPYEIAEQIGVGGMGEVYRATDTNLKRAVAIKVLPVLLAADGERLARFQREAEVLATLSHPHIAGIYGLERANGVTALVMELVEGTTLAERIERGAIPLDEALPIETQIADALESAHESNIVHRDLKPANIDNSESDSSGYLHLIVHLLVGSNLDVGRFRDPVHDFDSSARLSSASAICVAIGSASSSGIAPRSIRSARVVSLDQFHYQRL